MINEMCSLQSQSAICSEFRPINVPGCGHYSINREGVIRTYYGRELKYQTNDSGNRTICLYPKGIELKEYHYGNLRVRNKCYSVDKLVRLTFPD